MESHLEVSPKDLRFRADNKKQPPTVMYLTNRTSEHVAFKVKTTAPKRYCVKPSADVVGPGTPAQPTTMEVRVFMQQSKDLTAAAAAECKDKFLIQSTPVPPDWSIKADGDGKSNDFFNRKENPKLYEEKLRVTLEAPPQPPSPVPEASETAELNSADVTNSLAQPRSTTPSHAPSGPLGKGVEPATVEEYRAENRKLREQLALAEMRSIEKGSGYRIVHLLPIAILAFLLGYLL